MTDASVMSEQVSCSRIIETGRRGVVTCLMEAAQVERHLRMLPVSSLVSVAVTRHHNQKLYEGKDSFNIMPQGHSPSLREVRQEPWKNAAY